MQKSELTQEIRSAFQRYVKSRDFSVIKVFTLSELREADEQLGDNDIESGYRIAMRNRIKDIELENAKAYNSKIRALQLITAFIIGLLVAYFGTKLF